MFQMQLPQEKQQKQSTASHSSKQVKKKQKAVNCIPLVRTIQSLIKKNQSKYETILNHNPEFIMKLYRPTTLVLPQKLSAINEEILLKQLDNLMEDQCKLDKEINKIHFQIQEDQKMKVAETSHIKNHYFFLRSIWKKEIQNTSTEERIQELNQKIGYIKGHIKNLISQQGCQSLDTRRMVIESKQYSRLKERYERQLMAKEDERQILKRQPSREGKQNLQSVIEKLQQQNLQIRNKYQQERQKTKKLQNQVFQLNLKIHSIQKEILDKDKQLNKIKRQNKYIYKSQHDFSLILVSKTVPQHKIIPISKTFPEVHSFLTTLPDLQQSKFPITSKIEQIKNQFDIDAVKVRKIYNSRNQKQNPRKIRHIKGINDLKSVDSKRPKFIRSAGLGDDEGSGKQIIRTLQKI